MIDKRNLFEVGNFTLHSGGTSWFKIDCDNLLFDDIRFLAHYIVKEMKLVFDHAYGIPDGGIRLAEELNRYVPEEVAINATKILIVDDVLTTGKSMEDTKKEIEEAGEKVVGGVVIFARGKCPSWVVPVFQMYCNE